MLATLLDLLARPVAPRIDRAFVHLAFRSRRSNARGRAETSADLLDEAAEFYAAADARGRLFERPRPADLRARGRRRIDGGEVVDVTWPSQYRPLHPAYERFAARHPRNATACARWLRHRSPAPAVVCLHGWGGGVFAVEQRTVLARMLYRAGADVVLAVLPFHGPRASDRLGVPLFPSPDPMRTNEGCAQIISDLRALLLALRAHGAPRVAVTGESLGGFTSALLATVEPRVDATIPVIPFGSLPVLMWMHGEGTPARSHAESMGVDFARFSEAFRATTPLSRRPRVPAESMLLIAGERDRVTPPHLAQTLRDHFSRATGRRVPLALFSGSHLLQAGRARAFAQLRSLLAGRGLLPRPEAAQVTPADERRVAAAARVARRLRYGVGGASVEAALGLLRSRDGSCVASTAGSSWSSAAPK